jgi:hypothetical protein
MTGDYEADLNFYTEMYMDQGFTHEEAQLLAIKLMKKFGITEE